MVSIDNKFKALREYWKTRFEAIPVVTPHKRSKKVRLDAFETLVKHFQNLLSQGFDICTISELLKNLIDYEIGYSWSVSKIKRYDLLLGRLKKHFDLPGVQYSYEILFRHQTMWRNHTKRWIEGKKKPSKAGTKYMRSHLIWMLVEGSRQLIARDKKRRHFTITSACNLVSEIIQLLGLRNKDGLEIRTLQKDYKKWKQSKTPIYSYGPDLTQTLVWVDTPTEAFDPLLKSDILPGQKK